MKRLITMVAIACLPLVGCASKTVVPTLTKGDVVSLTGLENQFGNTFDEQKHPSHLMFVKGMEAKDLVQTSLKAIDKSCLDEGKLIYLADISGMPSLISSMIAIPKMQDYDYPILLDREGNVSAGLPVKEDQVTVIELENGTMKAAAFFPDPITLTQELITICGVK